MDEFDTPLLGYLNSNKLPKVGMQAIPGPVAALPLVLGDLTMIGRAFA